MLGEDRTTEKNKALMARFEIDLEAHLRKEQEKYTKKDPDFNLQAWLYPDLGHLVHHPAHTWIVKYSRENMHSVRSVQLFEDLDIKYHIFDGLHGVINVGKVLVTMLRDIQAHNGGEDGLVVNSLMNVLSVYPMLRELDVPGKKKGQYTVSSLNGNATMCATPLPA